MLYTAKQEAIKKEALLILSKSKPSKKELTWFFKTIKKNKETDEFWITHKID